MKTFQLPAQLDGYRSLRDFTLRLTFATNEISPEVMANIHYSLNKFGYLAFAPDKLLTQELEEIDKLKVEYEDSGKPPSQRLRGVLYRCWEQKNEGYDTFEVYYLARMEKLITHFKNKLT